MVNCKVRGKKRSWPVLKYLLSQSGMNEENPGSWFPGEIRTVYFYLDRLLKLFEPLNITVNNS